jgi:predicted O-linked N-acetylglucosamine transferase (SPINDLY family)
MANPLENLQAGFAHHRAGRLREAEAHYRQVLSADPRQADAWHLLGLLALQAGRPDAAEQCITRAIGLAGGRAEFHANLANALRACGQAGRAEQAARRALQLDPNLADAYNNLGNILQDRGDLDGASAAYSRAIELAPGAADPHNNLGTILHRRGSLDLAIEHYRRALSINPRYFDAYNNLGTALKAQGRLDEAADAYRAAIALARLAASAQLNLGTVLQEQGQLDEAIACYREALRLEADAPAALNNLGTALKEHGQPEEARVVLERAIALAPQLADAHYNLGTVHEAAGDTVQAQAAYERALSCDGRFAKSLVRLARMRQQVGDMTVAADYAERAVAMDPQLPAAQLAWADICEQLGRHPQAVAAYERAIQLKPDFSDAYNNLAMIYAERGQPDEAERLCRQGLAHRGASPALLANLATALTHQGRQIEAIEVARQAVEREPDSSGAHSNLLYALHYLPDQDPQAIYEQHLQWARRHADPLTVVAVPPQRHHDPNRRLRVGYVSPYFRDHAVSFFSEPLIASHDRSIVEVFLYSDNRRNDEVTERFRAAADTWRDVRYLSDEELAQQVRDDQIDILVDLTGHIALNRLLTFARRPAPVQVTYIGYQNTTGMRAMDYRLTDARVDPPGTDRYYSEKLCRLPRTYFVYRPAPESPELNALPALQNGFVTFGSFNNFTKVTPRVIDAWFEILRQVDHSRLLVLANRGGYIERHFARQAAAAGIDPGRIELFNRMPRKKYFELMQRADIALDPFPFNGHTTTCDQTWLGLPTVMLQGDTYVTRYASGVLAPVGLDANITRSEHEYIARAVALAGDVAGLAQLRQELRPRMADSVLLDFAQFARDVEAAYRQMWETWCREDSR